jgi:hypothetical protein
MVESSRGEALRRGNRTVDPLDFWTPGPGKDAGTLTTRVSNDIKHLIGVIIASKETPFQTPGEFVRAAVMWYMAEIKPRYDRGALGDTLRKFYSYIEGAERDAIALNLGRMQSVYKDKILKLVALGAERDAAREYLKMLQVARDTHPKFGKIMEAWASTEAAFFKVRPLAIEIEAQREETPESKCECGHRLKQHVYAKDKEGDVVSHCKVKTCPCERWDFALPEIEEER